MRLLKLTLLLVLFFTVTAKAGNVSREQALQRARKFMPGKNFTNNNAFARNRRNAPAAADAAFYVFNDTGNNGYVIVSGDDRTVPVLGYSDKGYLDMSELPSNVQSWLDGYAEQIAYLQEHPEARVAGYSPNYKPAIDPLLGETIWDQTNPFNDLCPMDGEFRCGTGCVATAMAQIMYCHKWPAQTTQRIPAYTTGTRKIQIPAISITPIDWDSILPDYLFSMSTEAQRHEVAKLMQLCGASVEMDYASGGSGASPFAIVTAFKQYFDYDASMVRRNGFGQNSWNQLVYEELSNGRPVLYGGQSEYGAHAFVIDGYDLDDYFHVNWGWGGYLNGNFLLNVLLDYNNGQSAIVGIQKKTAAPYATYENGTLTFYHDGLRSSRQTVTYDVSMNDYNYPYMEHRKDIEKVVFDKSFASARLYSLARMFDGCGALKSIEGLENLNTEFVTNMSWMFYGCKALSSLDLSNFDTSNVMDMYGMFCGCSALSSLDLSNFDTSNVMDMYGMFCGCSALSSLDLSNFDTSNVTDMRYMFYGCNALPNLDVSNFDTSNVTSMIAMFYNCSSLPSLDVSSFDTSNVTDMGWMFYGCKALRSLDVSNFDTSNVTNMKSMFNGCSSLPNLDVSNFKTSRVTDMAFMFDGCKVLSRLDLSNFDTSNVTDMEYMFFDCTALSGLDLSNFDTSNVTDMGMMFFGCSSLPILDLSNFNTSNVTNMTSMFCGCSSLSSLDVSNFNTSNVKYMGGVFNNCKVLSSLDVSNFDTSNVTNMNGLFYNCKALSSLDVSNFDTSNVTDMTSMFCGCSSLSSLDVSNFNTSNVTKMSCMFLNCSSLPILDLSNFDTSNVKGMYGMFCGCSALSSLDLSNFDTSSVTDMYSVFNGCSSLSSLDLSNFNTSNVTDMKYMFYGCTALTTIYVNDANWSTDSLTNSEEMFSQCDNLVGGNGTKYDGVHTNKDYARIDKPGQPGYLTYKPANGIEIVKQQNSGTNRYYTIGGKLLQGKPAKKGVYVVNGQKVMVE